MRIGVLALQGAFIEHERRDLERPFDGLILPGGESTVQGKLLRELGLFEPLREKIVAGLPTFGTCAGLILLAKTIKDDPTVHFGALDVTVERNAYGRQLGSFHAEAPRGDYFTSAWSRTILSLPLTMRLFLRRTFSALRAQTSGSVKSSNRLSSIRMLR